MRFTSVRRKMASVIGTALLALAVVPGAAIAAAPADECDWLQFCVYTQKNGQGVYQVALAQPSVCVAAEPELRGQVSSATNLTDWLITMYAGDACTGAARTINAGNDFFDLSIHGFDNQLRSFRFTRQTQQTRPCADEYWAAFCMFDAPQQAGEVQVVRPRPDGTCVDLQPGFKARVSSVRNQLPEQRAILFDGDGCTGASVTIGWNRPVDHLGALGFDDVLRSVRLVAVTGEPCGAAGDSLCLFGDAEYAGVSQVVPPGPAGACVAVAGPLIGRVTSVQNQVPGRRIALFSGDNCQGTSRTIDVAKEIPDLRTRQFDDLTRSVAFLPALEPCDVPHDNLCLYADVEWRGEREAISADRLGACVNIQSSLRGRVTSVENFTDQDLVLYAGLDCTGATTTVYRGLGLPDLTYQGFDNQTRSVRHVLTRRR